MASPVPSASSAGRWTSLWVVAFLSLLAQLALCQFFSFGATVPVSLDVDPSNLWKYSYQFPPTGAFLVLNWLGLANLPPSLNPFSLAAHLPAWLFFTTYTPVMSTLALLAMAAFLRELELPRPAALFGGLIFAWQGDILPFVFPGHYAYIGTWPFYALAAWGALRSQRTGYWAYALVSGASCGMMVAMQPDRGAIASLLIAAFYLAPALRDARVWWTQIRLLVLCAGTALLISFASFLALFQSFIVGVSMGGQTSRAQIYNFDTQFSCSPEETLTYLVPGFFGWHSSNPDGPYWGRIGQMPDWPKKHEGMRNLNLAISTTGTVPTVLALLAMVLLLPGPAGRLLGRSAMTERQLFYGRVLLVLGVVALVLAWGYHTPLYRVLFALPLMDKWRNPLKWLEITNFALVTLSALGVQHLIAAFQSPESNETQLLRRRSIRFFNGMLVLLVLGLLASYPFTLFQLAGKLQSEGYDPESIANIMSNLHVSMWVAVALAALASVMLRLLGKPALLRNWKLENPWLHRTWQKMMEPKHLLLTLALGLAALSVAQLAWVATKFIRPVDFAILRENIPLVDQLKSEGNRVRVSVANQDPSINMLLQNQFNTPGISCLEISAASRIPDAFGSFLGALGNDRSRLWFLAGVKNLVMPQAQFTELRRDPRITANIDHVDGYMLGPTSSPNLPSHALVQLRDYLAKATFVPSAEVLPLAAQLQRLRDPHWDPRKTVLLESGAHDPVSTEVKAPGDVPVVVNRYDSHGIDFVVKQAATPGYVLINDEYDPDWQVRVNGRETPLLRADYLLRAIPVPAGPSTVTLRYVPQYRLGGLRLPVLATNLFSDAAMLATWIVAGLALRRKSRLEYFPVK